MHIHFLGVCGTFMGGVALLAKQMGYQVTGSDEGVYPPMSTQLEAAGIDLIEGFDASQLDIRPDQVVVGMGPGPFTGLRVGITFAQTFGLARKIPVVGVCSLDAIAINQSEYTVAIGARRKEIYWASYKDGVRVSGPAVSKPAEVENFIIDQYPNLQKLVALSTSQNITEPMYLRRPDAVPTAERA